MQTIFDINGSIMTETPTGPIKTTSMENAMIYAGGAIMMFVAGYVFLAGAVIMIVRTVWLLILMIGSPFAFLSYALPSRGGFASWWWGQLVGQVFVAPAFLFMLYICSLIISSNDLNMMTGAVNAKMALAFVGRADNYAIIYNFAVMIILLLACLTVANKVSSGAGSMGSAWAKKMIGGGAALGFAGVAAAGRQTYGRNAAASLKDKDGKETEWAKKQRQLVAAGGMKDATFLDKSKARLANSRLALAEKGASGTYDIRNAPMGGLGVTAALGAAGIKTGNASKKSYETHGQALSGLTGAYRGTEKEKELTAIAKARFPNDPDAQRAYLEQRGVVLGADRNKSARDNIDAASKSKAVEDNKEVFENAFEAGKKGNEELEKLQKQKEEITKKGGVADAALVAAIASTAESVKEENEKVRRSMQLMSGENVAKLMNKDKYRDSTAVRDALTSKDHSAINKYYLEGKYKESMGNKDEAFMAKLTTDTLKSAKTPEATKRMIKNAMKNGTWGHEIDFKKELNEKLAANASDKEISETWAMLDNEDKADLKELLLNEKIASRINGATLGVIGKRGNEGFYDDVPEFREKLADLHTRGVLGNSSGRPNPATGEIVNTAASHIDKNSGKLESYYYQMPKSTAKSAAATTATTWNLPTSRRDAISANVKRHHELTKKFNTAPSTLTPQESAELATLKAEVAVLSGNEKSFADDVRSKLS